MKNFGLDQQIVSQNAMAYMAELIEKNEKQEIDIERGKLSVAILKQVNNRIRLALDVAKYELAVKVNSTETILRREDNYK